MSAHTPGPWRIEDSHPDKAAVYIRAPGIISAVYPQEVAVIYRVFERDERRYLADANLLAAAPDLLEMLKEVREWHCDNACEAEHTNRCRDMRSAIERAEGK